MFNKNKITENLSEQQENKIAEDHQEPVVPTVIFSNFTEQRDLKISELKNLIKSCDFMLKVGDDLGNPNSDTTGIIYYKRATAFLELAELSDNPAEYYDKACKDYSSAVDYYPCREHMKAAENAYMINSVYYLITGYKCPEPSSASERLYIEHITKRILTNPAAIARIEELMSNGKLEPEIGEKLLKLAECDQQFTRSQDKRHGQRQG